MTAINTSCMICAQSLPLTEDDEHFDYDNDPSSSSNSGVYFIRWNESNEIIEEGDVCCECYDNRISGPAAWVRLDSDGNCVGYNHFISHDAPLTYHEMSQRAWNRVYMIDEVPV